MIEYLPYYPPIAIGFGYLATYRIANLKRQGIAPSWPIIVTALTWQFFVLPVNIVAPFILFKWWIGLILLPCILPAAAIAGLFVNRWGDESAPFFGMVIGLFLTVLGIVALLQHWQVS